MRGNWMDDQGRPSRRFYFGEGPDRPLERPNLRYDGRGDVDEGPEAYSGPYSATYPGGYSPSRAAYHRSGFGDPGFDDPAFDDYGHDRQGRPLSSGTGGYGYEGREAPPRQRFEEASRDAGRFLHRAGERVAHWFGAGEHRSFEPGRDLDPRDRGFGDRGYRGRGPKDYKRSDERIREDANERLTEDRWLDASDISLSVTGGEVTLSGTVEDRYSKHRAERIVEDVTGVTHVQNNLRVAVGLSADSAAGNGAAAFGDGPPTAERES